MITNPPSQPLSIGFFSSLSSLIIPIGTDLIRSNAHTVSGIGSAFYKATSNTGATAYRQQSANGRWFELITDEQVNVLWFGAVGDDRDDTLAIQAWIDYCRTNGRDGYAPAPPNRYRVTQSLNCTPVRTYNLYGDGKLSTQFYGVLTEAYPIFDFTDGKRCSVSNICVRTDPTSLDTCSMLIAETKASGANMFEIHESAIYNSSLNSKASVISVSADEQRHSFSEITANGPACVAAFRIDRDNSLGVASKFSATSPSLQGADETRFSSIETEYLCAGGPAFSIAQYNAAQLTSCYLAIGKYASGTVGTTSTGIIQIESGTGRQFGVDFRNCRTEDQSGSTNSFPIFWCVDNVQGVRMDGYYTTGNGRGLIGGPGIWYSLDANVRVSGSLFDSAGRIFDSKISALGGTNTLGTFDFVNSNAVEVIGRIGNNEATLVAAAALCPNFKYSINGGYGPVHSLNRDRVMFSRSDSPTNWRTSALGAAGILTVTSNVASTATQVVSVNFPVAVMAYNGPTTSVCVFPSAEVDIEMDTTSGWAASGSIALTTQQNGGTVTTLTTLSSIPAGTQGVLMKLRLRRIYGNAVCVWADIEATPTGGGTPLKVSSVPITNPTGVDFVTAAAGDMIIGVVVNNTAAAVIHTATYAMRS